MATEAPVLTKPASICQPPAPSDFTQESSNNSTYKQLPISQSSIMNNWQQP